MKKILLSLLMLCCMTAAWAGEGDGSKDHPYSGVWQASELAPKLKTGDYLAYGCDIQNGQITVTDSKLHKMIAQAWPAWSPGNVLGSSDFSGYDEYYKCNSLSDRKSQLFVITEVTAIGSGIAMTGYFSGVYDYAGIVLPTKKVANVEYYVINNTDDYETFRHIVATGNPYANAILDADITVTEPIGSGDVQFHYRGTFDGQGHTIDVDGLANGNENHPWGLFQFTEPGCVIKNLKVTGELTSKGAYMGSIVGQATGTRIENCSSNTTLTSSVSTDVHIGGFIGVGYGVNFVTNSSFTGSIDAAGFRFGVIGSNPHAVCIKDCSNDKGLESAEGSTESTDVMGIPNSDGKKVFVGSLNYELDTEHKTATVTQAQASVKAIHVAETIHYNGNDYTVKYIGKEAFKNSEMEYCYIPKTVTNIADDAFNGCNKLEYLHIADGPSTDPGSGSEAGVYMGHKSETHELFEDCPLKKVYIGRNLRWYSSMANPDEPFEDRNNIADVFFGPRVTRVGNAHYSNAREGLSYHLFNNCTGIQRVYIMGDDQSLNTEIEVWTDDGMKKATDYYVNRTIKTTEKTKEFTTYWQNGIFKNCANVAFGPFVEYVGDDLLGGRAASANHTLKTADFTNAFRLERIDTYAFNECMDANFTGLDGQYPLKSIGDDTFYNCVNLYNIRFGTKLTTIGERAFQYCENLAYISIPGTVTSIGIHAFGNCTSLLGVKFEDSDIILGDIFTRFVDCSNISSVYIGREMEKQYGGPFGASYETLSSIEIGPKVKTIPHCIFSGTRSFKSISFDYSPEPLKFQDTVVKELYAEDSRYNQISSLFIDRKLVDKDDNEIVGDKWGYLRETVNFITFGEHITKVSEGSYTNFKNLNHLFIPRSTKTIGANAFSGSEGLKSLILMGAPTIGVEAFANCTELETIIVNNDSVIVSNNAFANCDNIKDITLNSNGNIPYSGSETAFSTTTYQKTKLYSPYDTKVDIVEFDKAPWSKFSNHMPKRNDDFVPDLGMETAVYEHASIQCNVNDEYYEAFYAPFQWDSYYFGSDAEVYSLNVTEYGISEDISQNKQLSTHSIKVDTVKISELQTLPAGIYVVKTKYHADDLHATRNLFFDNGVAVNNTITSISNLNNTAIRYGGDSRNLNPDRFLDIYVVEDGVMKLINATYLKQSGGVAIATREFNDQLIFNINKNSGETLFTSKKAVSFHEKLEGYATFYNETYNVLAPEWCEVYVVTGEENGEVSMEKIEDRVITAGQAVIIKTKEAYIGAEDLMTYVTNGSQATDLYSKNLLRGVSENTEVGDICGADGFIYVLSCDAAYQNTGFYKFRIGKTLGAGKAYLLPSDFSDANLAKACLFSFSNEANGIKSTSESTSESIYDLSGKRIDANHTDAKGVYIIDSKKVVK